MLNKLLAFLWMGLAILDIYVLDQRTDGLIEFLLFLWFLREVEEEEVCCK